MSNIVLAGLTSKARALSDDENVVAIVKKMARERFSREEMCLMLGIQTNELEAILKVDCALTRAIIYGALEYDLDYGDALYSAAMAGDVNAIKWYDSTRRGLRTQSPNPAENSNKSIDVSITFGEGLQQLYDDDD